MAKKILKRFLPDPNKIRQHKSLKIFGDKLTNPNIWHLNRRSVAKAFFIGLFISYIPAPGHTIYSTLLAIAFRANLPISIALVWLVANPFTMAPMYYFGYVVGNFIFRRPPVNFHFELSFQWIVNEIGHIAGPLFLGCIICGLILGLIGYIAIRLIWRISVVMQWRTRQARHKKQ